MKEYIAAVLSPILPCQNKENLKKRLMIITCTLEVSPAEEEGLSLVE